LMDTADIEHNTRKNILSSSLQWVGVSIQPHKTYCANTVIDFAKKPVVTAGSSGRKSKQQTYAHLYQCPKSTKVIVKRRKFLGLF
jgi:hypothetical protein